VPELQLSPDGAYYWDGKEWVSTISHDRLYRWDGRAWVPLPGTLAASTSRGPRLPTRQTRPLQIAVIEYCRNVLKLKGANSTEFDANAPHPVINMMEEQKKVIDKGATMRLGSYECALTPGTLAHKAYGTDNVRERRMRRIVA